ncbi:putative carbamoyl phosphate synthase small subunit [Escherichia coli 6-175-07_S3_C3]|nr:putative carbamoyl phosphate synthase small subunit [Escherichia coli 8-415-05_S4_C2]KEL50650.1 putative carbamoyl phosphate synthase small subunit [Escherichia coli 6-175-07_S1_C1]KEM07164.1 putative carbamoyl phosphate synthase small subunit [Escherichia coli 6-175-07_S3_C3]KEM67362.1 putative carbamoyl phosphate synthase small subunit [Escherichia coli 6-319-05_S3_C3]
MHEPKNNKKNPAIKLTFSSHISRMPPFARNSSVSRFALIYVIIVN